MKVSNPVLLLILLLAASVRVWLIHSDGVVFSSDEAVVGLMARHIAQGKPVPTFYYGQDYMGSLDAILIAAGFKIFGESIRAIRYTQLILFLLIIWTSYLLAYQVTKKYLTALISAFLVGLPPMLGTTYTTLTLGGYNEILLFGNLVLLSGWQITVENSQDVWQWFLAGFFFGLGWWTNAAIITPAVVVSLIGLRYFSYKKWRLYGLAAGGFFIGSAPWWIYNLNHNFAALEFLLKNEPPPGVESLTLPVKFFAFLFIGLSGIYGFRFPWEAAYHISLLSLVAAFTYLLLITRMIARWYARFRYRIVNDTFHRKITPSQWVWLCFLAMGCVFMVSSFQDATGRYLLPLWIPAMIGVAVGIEEIKQSNPVLATVILVAIITFHLGTMIIAAKSDTGIEAQLSSQLQADERYDAQLLAFLEEQNYRYGYAAYWVSYRLMFRSSEKVIFDTSLPYDKDGYRAHNNRYKPYVKQVEKAERVVWITQNFPELDAWIAKLLAERHITYQTRDFGPYHVYYDFSDRISPAKLNLNSPKPFQELIAEHADS